VTLVCVIWLILVLVWFDRFRDSRGPMANLLLLLNPFGMMFGVMNGKLGRTVPLVILIAQITIPAAYWFIAAWRYQRQAARPSRAEVPGVRTPSLHVPFVSAALDHPLFWKERREQISIMITAGIAGVGLALLFSSIAQRAVGAYRPMGWGSLNNTLGTLSMTGAFVPALVAAILGFSSMVGDHDEGVAGFWRSRPIAPGRLFWMKYGFTLLGVGILAAFFEVPYMILSPIIEAVRSHTGYVNLDYPAVNYHAGDIIVREFFALPLVLSLTCLFATLFRRTIYAAILALAAGAVILFIPVEGRETVGDVFLGGDLPEYFGWVVVGLAILTVGSTALARVAFGRGWRVG
jgi:hypothetical protein